MEGMLAEIRMFGGNFAPRSWALCEGQLLPIAQNSALFSLLGTIYGGDGRTTFALPDMRGRSPMGNGSGPGLTPRREGQKGGSETVTLAVTQMPSHSHLIGATEEDADTNEANGHILCNSVGSTMYFDGNIENNVNLKSTTVRNTGGNQPHNNLHPFLVVNFIICTQGVFPSRS